MFSFSPNDFLACNGTRVGAQHLHDRMETLHKLIEPHLLEQHPDLTAIISPIYATTNALVIGFYTGWWTPKAMQNTIANRKRFRGIVPRKNYRCFAGDIIVESPQRSVPWSPAKLNGVDRSLFVGTILSPQEATKSDLVDDIKTILTDLYPLYALFTEARRQNPEPSRDYIPDPVEPSIVKDALAPKEAELLCELHRFTTLKNFRIQPDMLFNLYLCLKTKPFLLLAGISGTGKSTVIRLIAEAINGIHESRAKGYRLIPVRPDWHDVRDLLGFENLLTGIFRPGSLLHAMCEAQANPDRPYFVCLDEMNLARVEHYFADFLSIMETARRTSDGAWTTDPIQLAQGRDTISADDLGNISTLQSIPPNLFFIGTVNVDETTHAFSPKVLDRANTIAFDHIDLSIPDTDPNIQIDSTTLCDLGPALIDRPYRQLDYVLHRTEVMAWNEPLQELNTILSEEDLQFGYRIRDEILIYLAYALDLIEALPPNAPTFTAQDAFDYQILQKILPRLYSTGHEADALLDALITFCNTTYPRSTQKLQRIKRRLERTGFASFW